MGGAERLSDMALLTLACWCLFVRDWLRLSLREAADEELRRSGCEYDSWQVDIHVSTQQALQKSEGEKVSVSVSE